jgi:hypothetical protein
MKQLGRKFTLSAYALVSASLLALAGKLTPEYATICTIVVGAFNASNAYITGKLGTNEPPTR